MGFSHRVFQNMANMSGHHCLIKGKEQYEGKKKKMVVYAALTARYAFTLPPLTIFPENADFLSTYLMIRSFT